jgi:cell division protein FtsB
MTKRHAMNKVTGQLVKRLARSESRLRQIWPRALLYMAVPYVFWLFCMGDYGLFRIYRLHKRKAELETRQQETVVRAIDLHYALRRLRTDPKYVEWIARNRYGFSRADEIIYYLDLSRH